MSAAEEKKRNADREWLRKMAEAEDRCGSVSVGGLASDLGMLSAAGREAELVFGRLIEFARRAKGISLVKLAEDSDVDVEELFILERGLGWIPEPRTVFQLAKELELPLGKLQELSGLAEPRDEALKRASVRFAALAEPTAELSRDERIAYEEFVRVLADRTKKGAGY